MAEKTGLILEGGGVRGAYTAGALSWLSEQNIQLDYNVGISTGAAYLAIHLSGETEIAREMSTGFAVDPENVGLKAWVKCGHFVDGKRIFNHFLKDKQGFRTKKLRESSIQYETGLYDLEKGKTVFYSNKDLDDDMDLIRAGCSLPLASEIVEFQGRKVLDGGITKMIPVERALEQGCTKCLIITTKPASFVRKAASPLMVALMGLVYRKYPTVKKDYSIRHLNYIEQMKIISDLVEKKQGLVIAPSETIKVNRFKADPEKCQAMYRMGYKDIQRKQKEIFDFLGIGKI